MGEIGKLQRYLFLADELTFFYESVTPVVNIGYALVIMNIRRADVNDAPQLTRVHVDSWQVACRGLVPDSFLARYSIQKREEAFCQSSVANFMEETHLVEENVMAIGILN